MRTSVGNIVHSIIRHGLSLRDRLEAGETLDAAVEQETLIEMLAPLALEEIWDAEEAEAFGPDLEVSNSHEVHAQMSQAAIRYALVAWLDSFLVRYSLWGSTWKEHALEAALYGTERRGQRFWEEASYAETRKDHDALAVLYWCVMLGYRGEGRGRSEPTGVWTTRIRMLLDEAAESADAMPVTSDLPGPPPTPVSDLPYRRMVFTALMTTALAAPATIWLAWRHWAI